MSVRPIISYQNVNKRFAFQQGQPQSVLETVISFARRSKREKRELHAVRDVSFDVYKGESVGLIGHNGSGKSTLLKLATRILRPTSGRVRVHGRVSALLELGAGFHDELTGRENIYLNGSVLGLSKQEIGERFDEIVAFSELEKFIDMPVKHYSSGMYMRLGFAVAVHCDPDILLVDEILAVGDRAFQTKCIERIYDLKQQGITIIMVSHNLETLQKLCTRLVWMDGGVVREIDEADSVIARYIAYMNSRHAPRGEKATRFERWGSYEAEINAVRFLDENDEAQDVFMTGAKMTIEMQYVAHRPIKQPEMGFAIFREDGVHVNGPNNRLAGHEIDEINGAGVLRYNIQRLPLLPGEYLVSAAIQDGVMPQAYDFHSQAYRFRVAEGGTPEVQGLIELDATWEWQAVPQNEQRS